MEVRPIRTQADYKAALALIEKLFDASPGTRQADELDLLATLVEAYEEKHFPIEPTDAVDAILFRMEQMGLSRKDLEPHIGGSSRVSEVLNRKRGLSLAMIRSLHEGLRIPIEALVRSGAESEPENLAVQESKLTRKKSRVEKAPARKRTGRVLRSEVVG